MDCKVSARRRCLTAGWQPELESSCALPQAQLLLRRRLFCCQRAHPFLSIHTKRRLDILFNFKYCIRLFYAAHVPSTLIKRSQFVYSK